MLKWKGGGSGDLRGVGGGLTDCLTGLSRCKALMLVGPHSAGQCAALHPVPRLCVNSAAVTIYSSCPSSI